MDGNSLPILDCHQHLFDNRRLRYPLFAQRSAGFEALVGDYSALPRVYLPKDYERDTSEWNVLQTIWAEFISDDAVNEARWAEDLARTTGHPGGMIAQVDFLSPDLDRTLDTYATMQHVRCVRQHLGCHPTNPLLRFAAAPDILSDAAWKRGLATLGHRNLICELEIFASQLPDLASVAAAFPDVQFVLPLMGWPVDLTSEGQAQWKRALAMVPPVLTSQLRSSGWNASSGSTGGSLRSAPGYSTRSRSSARAAQCLQASCPFANLLAAFSSSIPPIAR